jgi:hypothetical protein
MAYTTLLRAPSAFIVKQSHYLQYALLDGPLPMLLHGWPGIRSHRVEMNHRAK